VQVAAAGELQWLRRGQAPMSAQEAVSKKAERREQAVVVQAWAAVRSAVLSGKGMQYARVARV